MNYSPRAILKQKTTKKEIIHFNLLKLIRKSKKLILIDKKYYRFLTWLIVPERCGDHPTRDG